MITQHIRARATTMPACVLALAGTLTAALMGLTLACGDDSGVGPSATSPNDNATQQPGGQVVFDLATDDPLLTIAGTGPGAFTSDIPALASGDFNRDGFDDLLIGARFANPDADREEAGEAYIVFGREDIGGSLDLGRGDALRILGPGGGAHLGFSVVAADFDGDGIDDAAIGAPFAAGRDAQLTPGAVYIIFGSEGMSGDVDLASGDEDVAIFGRDPSGFFGDSLAAGDVNGDGTTDLVIGATFARHPGGGTNAGAAFVLYGRNDWPDEIADDGYDVALYGEDPLDELGDTVAVGDLNGDGYADVIAAAEAADGPDNERPVAGEVVVLLGAPDLSGDVFVGVDDVASRIYGAETNDTLGFDLAAGDLDGDGLDDMAMTARLAGGPGNAEPSAGEAYVLFGSQNLPLELDLAADTNALVSFYSADAADLMGSAAIVPAGDEEGRLLLGAGFGDGPANSRDGGGELYAVRPVRIALQSPLDTAAVEVYYGGQAGDGFGGAAVALDMNGDGRLELAVTAPGADPEPNRADFGVVYVMTIGP